MSPSEFLAKWVLSLGEVDTLRLAREIRESRPNNVGLRPPFEKGEFDPQEVERFFQSPGVAESSVTALLRIVNPSNEAIAYLHRLGQLPIRGEFWSNDVWDFSLQLSFSTTKIQELPPGRSGTANSFILTDLAASSAALSELFIDIAAANYALGISLEPPIVTIDRGSVQFSIGGGLLAAGIALIVSCQSGLGVEPISGLTLGGALSILGTYDLYRSWKRTASEEKKFDTEALKLKAEAMKLQAEAIKFEAEAEKLKAERYKIEGEHKRIYEHQGAALSGLVSRDIVERESERLGLSSSYSSHLLNRALPKYAQIKKSFEEIDIEIKR